jgi:hypothetical protein
MRYGQVASISGLTSLTSVGGDLIIEYSYDLSSITGLQDLASVDGAVAVRFNGLLASVAFLNPSLSGALVRVGATNTGAVSICANAAACVATGTALTTALAARGWTGTALVNNTCQ